MATGWRSTSIYSKDNVWVLCCKKDCRCSSFGLEHGKPYVFAESLWQTGPNLLYVLYRIIVAIYFLAWLALSGTGVRNDPTWLIFLTNWSFLLLNLRLLVQAYIATAHYIHHEVQGRPFQKRLNLIMKVEWVLYNITGPGAFISSLLFWIFLYLPQIETYELDIVSIHTHGVNSAVVLLDLGIAAIPLRFPHIFHSLGYILIYFIFNAVYVFAGGRNENDEPVIYGGFNWLADPSGSTLSVVYVHLITAAVWIFQWLWSWKMRWLASCCCPFGNVRSRSKRHCSGGGCGAGSCGQNQVCMVECGMGASSLQGCVNHGGVFSVCSPTPQGPHVYTIQM